MSCFSFFLCEHVGLFIKFAGTNHNRLGLFLNNAGTIPKQCWDYS